MRLFVLQTSYAQLGYLIVAVGQVAVVQEREMNHLYVLLDRYPENPIRIYTREIKQRTSLGRFKMLTKERTSPFESEKKLSNKMSCHN